MIHVERYHGTGNEFVIVDAGERVPDRGAFAAHACDPERGLGADGTTGVAESAPDPAGGADGAGERDAQRPDRAADGVLFLAIERRYDPTRVIMTLFQPDGGTAAMCGNGARCAARWAAERTGEREFMLDTQAGTRRAVVADGALEGDAEVTIEMGEPSFAPADVPLARDAPLVAEEVEGWTVTAVNTGVPHAVCFVDDVDDVDVERVAPPIRHADVFPEGANVTFAAETEAGAFDQRTFERGVEGETRSCGTGAVAIVAAARRLGRIDGDEEVTVRPPGGALRVRVEDRGRAYLRGPTSRIGGADVESDFASAP